MECGIPIGLRTWTVLALVAIALGSAGCSSDSASESPGRAVAPQAPAGPRGTTDSGSRLVDYAAPIGGVTVETPPVRGRMVDVPLPTRSVQSAFQPPLAPALPPPARMRSPPPPPPPSLRVPNPSMGGPTSGALGAPPIPRPR